MCPVCIPSSFEGVLQSGTEPVAEILNEIEFDKLLEAVDPFNGHQADPVVFDLREYTMVTAAGMVQLAAACHALGEMEKVPVILVENENVRTYLMRARFVHVVQPVAQFEPEYDSLYFDHLHGTNPMLIEVTKLEDGAALSPLLDKILEVLRKRLRYKKFDAFDIATAVSEVCQNTFDHNHTACGFIAMQVYGKGGRKFVQIGVADYGEGLATTLKKNPKNLPISSDTDAILKATRLGVSAHDDPTRGTGLHHLLDITYKHVGRVQIRSGRAAVRFRWDKKAGWGFKGAAMPGVQVAIALPTKKRS